MVRFTILALVTEESKDMFNRLIHPLGQIASRAGADGTFWLEVESSCPGNLRVSMQAAKHKKWNITSDITASAAARCLLYCQPSDVVVTFAATEETPAVLPVFLQSVTAHYEGKLWLHLEGSHDLFQPCDEMLEHLGPGRWQLNSFRGCVSSVAACKALTAGQSGLSQSEVYISLPEPVRHNLSALRGADSFHVTVHHCSVEPTRRCPLPSVALGIDLTIIASPAGSDDAVINLIMMLAPTHGYFSVLLQACLLTNAELTNVARSVPSVMTFYRGLNKTVKWKDARRDDDGRCRKCFEAHLEAQRCVTITC